MFKHIVYIHGFTGEHGYNGKSSKIEALQKYADSKGLTLHSHQYPDKDPHEAHAHLTKHIEAVKKKDPHALIVGTSLGGYWAHRLSNEHKLPSIIVNPAIDPHETLAHHVGKSITQKNLDAYKHFNDHHAKHSTVHEPRIVMLEKGDNVIDPHKTAKAYAGHAHVKMFDGGNHQFTRHNEITKAAEELRHTIVHHAN
jgi:predicted esterase YcpF (UPF0227 family)